MMIIIIIIIKPSFVHDEDLSFAASGVVNR